MTALTIRLDEAQYEKLRQFGFEHRRKHSEIIRTALAGYLDSARLSEIPGTEELLSELGRLAAAWRRQEAISEPLGALLEQAYLYHSLLAGPVTPS